jgi:hypothetical protein
VAKTKGAAYYVSTKGSDTNPGKSLISPLRTIQKAVDVAQPGDTIFVRGGTYRETVTTSRSGTATALITIQNYQKEAVTVSGIDPITGPWTPVGKEVYRAPMPWDYHFENEKPEYNSNQVFDGNRMMEIARWPNQTSRDLVRPTLALADNVTFSKSDPSLPDNDLATFHKADFTDNPARWVGAKIWVNLSRDGFDGQGDSGTVVSATAGSVTVKEIDTRGAKGPGPWSVGKGTEFYLFHPTLSSLQKNGGIAAALDRGEWFIDTNAKQIYVRTYDGKQPVAGAIKAKRRTYGFNFDGDSYITLRGIGLFATSLTTDNDAANRNNPSNGVATASNIIIDGMKAYYVTHSTDSTGDYQQQWSQRSGIILSGTKITFQNGEVRYSSASGLSIIGRQNKVLNNVLHDLNFSVSEAGLVNFGSQGGLSEDHDFGYNTLYNSPQQGINYRGLRNSTNDPKNSKARIHHNRIYDVMLRCFDSSAIDSAGTSHQYVRIDHNLIYNLTGERQYGVYFDFGSNGIIDHNVIYNVHDPININSSGQEPQNMWILNNIAISSDPKRAGIETGASSSVGSIIRNNIWSLGIWSGNWPGGVDRVLAGAIISNNILASDDLFVDSTNKDMALRNYQLKSTATTAINQGISIPPYDDKLVGLPDIGAYEYGVAPWTVGAGQMKVSSD